MIGAAASATVVGLFVVPFALQGPGEEGTLIEVVDQVGVLHEPDIQSVVDDLNFYEPTDVAVITLNVPAGDRWNDDAFNRDVLAFAESERPEWITDDGQKWADDLYIFGIDPDGRFVGTYFGGNRAVDDEGEGIRDGVVETLQRGRWTEAAVEGIEAGAGQMNRPWIRSTAGIVVGLVASLLTLGAAGTYLGVGLWRRGRARRARAEGDRSFANVVRDYEETEVHANLIPVESVFGWLMKRKFDEYTSGFASLTTWGNQARSVPASNYDTQETLDLMESYRDKPVKLDHLDDVIADTAALLNMDNGWAEAWSRQEASLRQDLSEADGLVTGGLGSGARGTAEAQALRSFATSGLSELDTLRGDLDRRSISPDDALKRLQQLQDDLTGLLEKVGKAAAAAEYSKMSEQRLMQRSMARRSRTMTGRPTILTTTDPTWTWISVGSFRSGYSSGQQAVSQSRSSSSSSSGSSTSYSSSGGSFSGSGGSSRF